LPEGWGISTKKDSREELIERQSNKNATRYCDQMSTIELTYFFIFFTKNDVVSSYFQRIKT